MHEEMLVLTFVFMSLVGIIDTHLTMTPLAESVKSKLCRPNFSDMVECTDQGVLLRSGYCATETNGDIYIAKCHYFQLNEHNMSLTEPGYIQLPDNISELNDYMCGPMNRKGLLCKDCIDGFGPSVTSLGYKCSNCTDAWYGIPLYLAAELIPITLFYLIILIFKVHLTSAPMVLFILYNQLIMYEMIFQRSLILRWLYSQGICSNGSLLKSLYFFYGIWNLTLIRFIVPPFCISSKLQLIHFELLGYMPIVYFLLLIFLTWVCIELHGRNFRLFVVLWHPFHRCFVKIQRGWDKTSSMVDVFASFFLLSHGIIVYQTITFFRCEIQFYTVDDISGQRAVSMFVPSIDCNHRSYLAAIFSALILFAFNIFPILLLVLYPFKLFRVCLSKCKLERLFVTIFVEKFHGCYRDGLNGGRDMRSFSGLYYLMITLMSLYSELQIEQLHISEWLYYAFIFLSCALLIIIARPYKQKYMNISDTLLLAYTAVICILLSRNSFVAGDETQIFILLLIPPVVFGLVIIFKACIKLMMKSSFIKEYKNLCKQHFTNNIIDANETQSLINPTGNYITYGNNEHT